MARRIASLFFLIILGSSVLFGMPLGESRMDKKMCPMKCCKNKAQKKKTQRKDFANLCRTLNCNNPVPTNTNSSSQISFAALYVAVKTFPIFRILLEAKNDETREIFSTEPVQVKTTHPKYIQHLSLLI